MFFFLGTKKIIYVMQVIYIHTHTNVSIVLETIDYIREIVLETIDYIRETDNIMCYRVCVYINEKNKTRFYSLFFYFFHFYKK